MTRIGADTTHLYETVAALRQGSSNIENALRQATQGMEALQGSRWSGQHRQQAEAIWARIQGQFVPTVEALKELAARTERFANALEEAGRVFGNESNVAGVDKKSPRWMGIKDIKSIVIGIKGFKEIFEVIKDRSLMSTLDFKPGLAYKDQVIIYGSRAAKEAIYLKGATTHMRGGWWNSLRKQAPQIAEDWGKGVLTGALFTTITSGLDNWEKYKDDDSQAVQKTAVATAIDTVVTTGCSATFTATGSLVGGALLGAMFGAASGGVCAPLGVALGNRLGGVLGDMAGEWVAEKVMESEWYTQNKEIWVQQGADTIDRVVNENKKLLDAGQEVFDSAVQRGRDTVKMIDSEIRRLLGG